MASSPANTNSKSPPPSDLDNFFTPPGISAQPSPVTETQHEIPSFSASSATNLHHHQPQRSLSNPTTTPLNLQSDAPWCFLLEQTVNNLCELLSKELNAMYEKAMKQESAEKTVSRRIGDIETVVMEIIRDLFQSKSIQESLRSELDSLVRSTFESMVPSFESYIEARFDEVNSHVEARFDEVDSHLEEVNSLLEIKIAEHRKDLKARFDEVNTQMEMKIKEHTGLIDYINTQLDQILRVIDDGPLAALLEKVDDPKPELSRLISEGKYEEAFTWALDRNKCGSSWTAGNESVFAEPKGASFSVATASLRPEQ